MGNDRHLPEKPLSLLQADQFFVNKILSRNSSSGRRRLSSDRLPGQIPFKWETRPGTPKAQPGPNHIPSFILPPPDLSKPYDVVANSKQPAAVRVWFWKKPKKKCRNIDCVSVVTDDGEFSRKSEDDRDQYVLSSCISYSLSHNSSSSSSSSGGFRRRRLKFSSLAKGFIRWAF